DTTTCADGIDNDCDGLVDCNDPNCSGVGSCPICGQVQHPLSQPLALPDGVNNGTACTSSSTCAASAPSCVIHECHAAYTSSLHFDGFAQNQTFMAVSNIQKVCVNMEHSWLRDLEIVLRAPDGKEIELQRMAGRSGGEVYLGHANDCDTAASPVPGTGADYCWTPTATNGSMIAFANAAAGMASAPCACTGSGLNDGCTAGSSIAELPPGDYGIDGQWTGLRGAPLNGDWTIVVTDAWGEDNGYIFSWSIAFDPSLVQDCSGPVIQ
ncbi:MAG TPA: hypothetical protein VLT45_18500, partial [Kofleriaceae bacterium]|nr:hypothetical protein [Kofleriaceae bacterium]